MDALNIDEQSLLMPWEKGAGRPQTDDELADQLLDAQDPEPDADPDTPEADEPESDDDYDYDEYESDESGADDLPVEESDDDSLEFDDEDDELFIVKVDGEELEVPLDELVSGYSRQSDYTRKTQALAEEREALKAEIAETRAVRQELNKYLEVVAQELGAGEDPGEEYWEKLRTKDPARFARERAEYQYQQERLANVRAAQDAFSAKDAEELQAIRAEKVAEERQKLVEAIPEFADEGAMQREMARLQDFLIDDFGVTPEELKHVVDHRFVVLARDAMLHREARKEAGSATRTKRKRRVLSPGARRKERPRRKGAKSRKAAAAAHKRLAETGRLDDAVEALMAAGFELPS